MRQVAGLQKGSADKDEQLRSAHGQCEDLLKAAQERERSLQQDMHDSQEEVRLAREQLLQGEERLKATRERERRLQQVYPLPASLYPLPSTLYLFFSF